MLKLLLKKQLTEIFRNYFYDQKKNRARSKAGIIGYILLFVAIMAGMLGGMFTALSLNLCAPLSAAGMDWLYFSLMGLLAILLGTFGSVFNTFSCMYLSKDNDLMLSLPIPVKALMASRLLTVYLMGVMYSIVVILPAVIVYWVMASVSVGVIFGSLLLMLLISVFILTLSCALGWVVAKISLKLKNKSFITVIVSLAFFGGYYFFCFKAQNLLQELLANAAGYAAKIKGAAYPLYLFGRVGTGDGAAMLMAFDFKKEYKEFYMSKSVPEIVTVPKANYIAVRGMGDPNQEGGAYQSAVSILYAVAYTLKMSYKTDYRIEGFFEYVVPPLEGFWWQEGVDGIDYGDKSTFHWISVIRLPEFVTKKDFDWAVEEAARKKKLDCSLAEFLTIEEGLCVQIMHIGSFDNEPSTVALMDQYIAENGYANDMNENRLHHEIYLSDARKVAPEKWKTIIRHPIRTQ